MEEKNKTLDYQREYNAKMHSKNGMGFEVACRECYRNGEGYSAHQYDTVSYSCPYFNMAAFAFATNAQPFESSNDIYTALELNTTSDKGTQGSGAKLAMFALNNRKNVRYGIYSKTILDGEKVWVLKSDENNFLIREDITKEYLPILKQLYPPKIFENITVINFYSFNSDYIQTSIGSGNKKSELICNTLNMYSFNNITNVNPNSTINYQNLFNKDVYSVNQYVSVKATMDNNRLYDHMVKEFKLDFDNVEISKDIKTKLSGYVTVKFFINITDKTQLHNPIYDKYGNNEFISKINKNSFFKKTIFLYQSNHLINDHFDRGIKDPMFYSDDYTNAVGILDLPLYSKHQKISCSDIKNNDKILNALKSYFVNDTLSKLNIDNLEYYPIVLFDIKIDKIDNEDDKNDIFGPIDSFFFFSERDKLDKVIDKVLRSITRNSTELKKCIDYISDFVPKCEFDKLLDINAPGNQNKRNLEIRTSAETIEFAEKNNINIPFIINKLIKKLPVGIKNMPVKFFDVENNAYLKNTNIIKAANWGIIITSNEFDEDDELFYINITNYCYLDNDNKTTFIDPINYIKNSKNYFPKLKYNFIVNDIHKITNLEIDVIDNGTGTPGGQGGKNGSGNVGKETEKEGTITDWYCTNLHPDRIGKWNEKHQKYQFNLNNINVNKACRGTKNYNNDINKIYTHINKLYKEFYKSKNLYDEADVHCNNKESLTEKHFNDIKDYMLEKIVENYLTDNVIWDKLVNKKLNIPNDPNPICS